MKKRQIILKTLFGELGFVMNKFKPEIRIPVPKDHDLEPAKKNYTFNATELDELGSYNACQYIPPNNKV